MAPYMDDYTSRRKTRIYVRPSDHEAPSKDDLIGQTQAIPIKQGLFDGLSVAQIIAGAAAAATSVALASYIGLAGSIIGAAVSSVVTVVSSQLYRRFLDASARKIKTAGNRARSGYASGYGSADATEVIAPAADAPGARMAPSKIRARAAAARTANQRKVIAFSVVIALIAVIACAAAILLGTAGAGLGEKTAPIIPAITREQPVDGGTVDTEDTEGEAEQADTDSDAADSTAPDDASGNAGTADEPAGTPSTGDAGASDAAPGTGAGENTGEMTPGETTTPGDGGDIVTDGTAGSEGSGDTSSQAPADGQTGAAQ